MGIQRKLALFWDNDNKENGCGEGVYVDLDVFDDELEEEEYINEECKMNIGFTKTWEEAFQLCEKLATQYNAEFDKVYAGATQ